MKRILLVAVSSCGAFFGRTGDRLGPSPRQPPPQAPRRTGAGARLPRLGSADDRLADHAGRSDYTHERKCGKDHLLQRRRAHDHADGRHAGERQSDRTDRRSTAARRATTGAEDNDDEAGSGEGDQGSSGDARASESSRNLARAADHGSGSDDGGGGDEGQQNCTTSALTEGALVREAELSIGSGGAVWDKVDLIQ